MAGLLQRRSEHDYPEGFERALHSKILSAAAITAVSLLVASGGAALAQSDDDKKMQVVLNGSLPSRINSSDHVTGHVRVDPIHGPAQEPSRFTTALVTFEPGARTNWHTHPLGQLLIVTTGRGWTKCGDDPRVEMNAGDAVWCPPGVKHWHGATSSTGMSHLVIQEALDGSVVDWLEPVTDEQYLASD